MGRSYDYSYMRRSYRRTTMMKYESPIWAEAKANRNIYVTDDLARAAEIKALDVHGLVRNVVPLYTAPPQRKECLRCGEVNPAEIHTCTPKREWVGLTAKDLAEIPASCYEGAIWADAKLKEKNSD